MNNEISGVIPRADRASYSLPMSRGEFARSLRLGHGRAIEHARAHGVLEYRDELVHAVLFNQAHDTQIEGGRSDWLRDLIDAGDAVDWIAPIVIEHAGIQVADWGTPNDYDDLDQRAWLLYVFAKREIAGAREALYSMLQWCPYGGYPIGNWQIIALDGEAGLITVVEHLNQWRAKYPQVDEYDWFLDGYDDDTRKGEARRVLEDVRDKSSDVDEFLTRLDAKQDRDDSEPYQRPDQIDGLKAFLHAVRNEPRGEYSPHRNDIWSRSRRWLDRALEDELQGIMEAIEATEDPTQLARLLSIFTEGSRKHTPIGAMRLPRVTPRILQLARHEDTFVQRAAVCALSLVPSAEVRALAVEMCTPEWVIRDSIRLFEHDYRDGDYLLIERALHIPEAADGDQFEADRTLHGLALDLIRLFGEYKTPDCRGSMLFVYEHSPCIECRKRAVEIMDAAGVTPQWVAREWAHSAKP